MHLICTQDYRVRIPGCPLLTGSSSAGTNSALLSKLLHIGERLIHLIWDQDFVGSNPTMQIKKHIKRFFKKVEKIQNFFETSGRERSILYGVKLIKQKSLKKI